MKILDKIRAFIAIPATEEIRQLIEQLEKSLMRSGADVKWVEPRNVHLTLKFLGNIPVDTVEPMSKSLAEVLAGFGSFEVVVSGLGTFPGGSRPRVIWLGFGEGKADLAELARRIEDVCADFGFERETRPFSPHLTIGRVRRPSPQLSRLRENIAQIKYNPLKLLVDRVNLMKSKLSPRGPTYTILSSLALEEK